jgi:hypothetical protein
LCVALDVAVLCGVVLCCAEEDDDNDGNNYVMMMTMVVIGAFIAINTKVRCPKINHGFLLYSVLRSTYV